MVIFADSSATTSIHHVTSGQVAEAPIHVRAHAAKVPPDTSLNFRNQDAGIATPTAVGATVFDAYTANKYPLTHHCVIVVPIAGTFQAPVSYGSSRIFLHSNIIFHSLIVTLAILPVIEAGEFECHRVSVRIVSSAPLFIVHVSPAVRAVPLSRN
jgi:hypothetical protein